MRRLVGTKRTGLIPDLISWRVELKGAGCWVCYEGKYKKSTSCKEVDEPRKVDEEGQGQERILWLVTIRKEMMNAKALGSSMDSICSS